MPHQCTRCNMEYGDAAPQLLNGCPCGSRVFIFKKTDLPHLPASSIVNAPPWVQVQQDEPSELEQQLQHLTKTATVVLEEAPVENIKVLEQGLYEVNVQALMAGDPVIVKTDSGVYYVRLPSKPEKAKAKHRA